MNIQNMMKLAEQHAEEQKNAMDIQRNLQTQHRLIMSTMINDGLNIDDASEKVIRLLIAKGIKDDDLEIIKALVSIAKLEVKSLLNKTKKLMEEVQ
ncbi:hypothetical protein ACTXL1_06820 [Psychrobacter celer]|uniref:hypothetical protein n=1 Tax=Psychrobacter celer TaxID=306572 RepID=UPI003FD5BA37